MTLLGVLLLSLAAATTWGQDGDGPLESAPDARTRVHVTHRLPPNPTEFDREFLADLEELVELHLADGHKDVVEVVDDDAADSADVTIRVLGLLEDQKQLGDAPLNILDSLEVKYEYEVTQRLIVDVERDGEKIPFEASDVSIQNWCDSCREWEGSPQLFKTTAVFADRFVAEFLEPQSSP